VEGLPKEQFIVAVDEAEAYKKAHAKYGNTAAAGGIGGSLRLQQEEDVLDTWFR